MMLAVNKVVNGIPHHMLGQGSYEDQVQYNPEQVVETPIVNVDELPLPPCNIQSVSQGSLLDKMASLKTVVKDMHASLRH